MECQLGDLSELVEELKSCGGDDNRHEVLNRQPHVLRWMEASREWRAISGSLTQEDELIIKSLVAIGQEEHLLCLREEFSIFSEKLRKMLDDLSPVERFYKEIGGIVGYHWTMLSSLSLGPTSPGDRAGDTYYRPPGIDISSQDDPVTTYILQGIVSLPQLAEIYPVGGAADRLKFFDPVNGQPLPAAKLQFGGYSLLEGLIRDVQAREYLYFKLFNEQITTPLVMMTSSEKDNHRHILQLCEERKWFGRLKDSFQIFCQPVVPTMDCSGKWCFIGEQKLLMKPGGHGVIWKVAKQEGVFDKLESTGRKKVLVRQINNPIAGIDYGILAFCGAGFASDKVFGFASCERQVKSAEGINVLIERKEGDQKHLCLTNIEYCDFAKFSIEDVPVEPGSLYSQFPSNTNILFADIGAVKESVVRCPIPGMLINLKQMSFTDEGGQFKEQEVARLESTMQNLADCFGQTADSSLPPSKIPLKTYLTYNHRKKTISTTKKMFQPDGSLLETPEGCFYDLLCNAYDLLVDHCQTVVPVVPPISDYILQGPSFLFSYHPALGPLFSIIGQKIRGGRFAHHSELKLEIAEVDIENLTLCGSLHISAERVIGQLQEDGILKYSEQVGSIRLRNVVIENSGYDCSAENVYWKGEIKREELCEIVIDGNGEFVAENVTIRGAIRIEVDDGVRVTAFEEEGTLKFKKEDICIPTKGWIYHIDDDGSIFLE